MQQEEGKGLAQPQHARIAAMLMSRIASGVYPVGGLLPTEHKLSEEFRRSRQTIREALRHLTSLNLVARQPGVGTRVVQQSPKAHFAYSINSLSELAEYALEARLEIASIRKVVVTGEQAALLECPEGASRHDIQGVRFRQADGVPLGVTEITSPSTIRRTPGRRRCFGRRCGTSQVPAMSSPCCGTTRTVADRMNARQWRANCCPAG